MAQTTDIFELATLQLKTGESRQLDLQTRIEPISLAGQRYVAEPEVVPVRVDVTRAMHGYSLRLRTDVRLVGPCMRCMDDSERTMHIDAREFDEPGGGEDLESPYVEAHELHLKAWARDSLVLELPPAIVCKDDCLGLCVECGENLNHAGPDHAHEAPPDPRWAKLGELKLD